MSVFETAAPLTYRSLLESPSKFPHRPEKTVKSYNSEPQIQFKAVYMYYMYYVNPTYYQIGTTTNKGITEVII
jgi:hypothetical protein